MNVDIIRVGSPLPVIAKATARDGRKVEIVWKDGARKIVDLMPALASHRRYMPLRGDDALFRTLRISEYGDAIEWDGDLDFSAVWIDRLPSAEFDNNDFRQAMEALHLSLDGMAAALEVSRRQVADFRRDKRIPKHIALATRYLLDHRNAVAVGGERKHQFTP